MDATSNAVPKANKTI